MLYGSQNKVWKYVNYHGHAYSFASTSKFRFLKNKSTSKFNGLIAKKKKNRLTIIPIKYLLYIRLYEYCKAEGGWMRTDIQYTLGSKYGKAPFM